MDEKKFLCVLHRRYNHIRLPRTFYNNFSTTFPRSLSLEDNFGLRIQATICLHSRNRAYLDCESDEILDAYQYGDCAVARLTYRSRGKFRFFVPDSSAYFARERGVAAGGDGEAPNGANANQEQAIERVIQPVDMVYPVLIMGNYGYDEIPVDEGPNFASDTDGGSVVN